MSVKRRKGISQITSSLLLFFNNRSHLLGFVIHRQDERFVVWLTGMLTWNVFQSQSEYSHE